MRRKQDRPFVLKLFDIFKHLKGLKSVDKIKKYHRNIPWGFNLHSPWPSGVTSPYWFSDSRWPRGVQISSGIPPGIPYYNPLSSILFSSSGVQYIIHNYIYIYIYIYIHIYI